MRCPVATSFPWLLRMDSSRAGVVVVVTVSAYVLTLFCGLADTAGRPTVNDHHFYPYCSPSVVVTSVNSSKQLFPCGSIHAGRSSSSSWCKTKTLKCNPSRYNLFVQR